MAQHPKISKNPSIKTKFEQQFLTNISHELRTPLVSIRGYTDMILSQKLGPINDAQAKCLKTCLKNISHLTDKIDHLLALSHMVSGKEHLRLKSVHIINIINDVIEEISPSLNEMRIRLIKNTGLSFPKLDGDPEKLKEALRQILDNAVKFNIAGGDILIDVHDSSKSVMINIENSGQGITGSHLLNLFKPFYQENRKKHGKHSGMGVGLALAKEIIELHCGEIKAFSVPNKRTAIKITLPKNLSVQIKRKAKTS